MTRQDRRPRPIERDTVLAAVKTTPLRGWRWRAKSRPRLRALSCNGWPGQENGTSTEQKTWDWAKSACQMDRD
jgi:hypothetical protein